MADPGLFLEKIPNNIAKETGGAEFNFSLKNFALGLWNFTNFTNLILEPNYG